MTSPISAPRPSAQDTLLSRFRDTLSASGVIDRLREGLIGKDAVVSGPYGDKPMVYADYVASGRALMQVEQFMLEQVLPYYANSHTQASYCGSLMTRLRADIRQTIARLCGASDAHAVIFAGSGATAGLNRLVTLLGVRDGVAAGRDVRVLIGPYEHHSNILPWRESGAKVTEIAEAADGGPDRAVLAEALAAARGADLVVCSFSAASNVTGIVSDIEAITRQVKRAGARMVWDYAGAAPYLPISMSPAADAEIDAIVASPHKFIGGPGASGLLIVRRDAVLSHIPTWTGGGTVRFVSPKGHDFSNDLESREEAGTPNVLGDIRAGLAFLIKEAIGDTYMAQRNTQLVRKVMGAWAAHERIMVLGNIEAERLPIFSFCIRDGEGGLVHQQLVTRMLSDCYGIQARGGCACAGPYVHRLLDLSPETSDRLRAEILSGNEIAKPGFTRLNFSVLLDEAKVDYIINSVIELAETAPQMRTAYGFDPARAIFYAKAG